MNTQAGTVSIEQAKISQISEIKKMIARVGFEILHIGENAIDLEKKLEQSGDFSDLNSFQKTYAGENGIFFVLVDDGSIVGSGAVRKLDKDTWELKRMWILKSYRGRGFGSVLYKKLEQYAKEHDAVKLRLDIFNSEEQKAAIRFYQKLGFYVIDPYQTTTLINDKTIYMEKILTS